MRQSGSPYSSAETTRFEFWGRDCPHLLMHRFYDPPFHFAHGWFTFSLNTRLGMRAPSFEMGLAGTGVRNVVSRPLLAGEGP